MNRPLRLRVVLILAGMALLSSASLHGQGARPELAESGKDFELYSRTRLKRVR